jgi:hypothetical protein
MPAPTLPARPEAVAAYLADLADRGRKPATIKRILAAIGYAHRLAGCAGPTAPEEVRATMRGIRRKLGVAPVRKVGRRRANCRVVFFGRSSMGTPPPPPREESVNPSRGEGGARRLLHQFIWGHRAPEVCGRWILGPHFGRCGLSRCHGRGAK